MRLTDKLPETVTIGGVEVPINSDFRTSVSFSMMIYDPDLSDEEKILKGLEMYYPTRDRDIYDIEEAVTQMLWFFRCGDTSEVKGSGDKTRAYDFDVDADSIFASFLMQYGIDLSTVNLHWWKFMAMLTNLKEDVPLAKIMTYRVIDTKGMDKEQAKFYKKMKRIYRLEDRVSETDEKLQQEIEQALIDGGDPSEIIERYKQRQVAQNEETKM